ncbi:hypothetical protein IF2G_10605 [Cordyceps javanica]|nr:hypothetical protein IF2G_10605 [Cordyceps javanica]
MAKYEQVMSGDSAKTQRASSADEGGRTAILPLSRDDNDRIDDKPTTSSTPRSRPSTRGTRGSRKGHSEAQSRVQKKRASVSRRYAYAFERLGGARRAARGSIEYEVYWASTWLPLDQLEGDDALQEAKDLVVDLFGPDMWHSEARKLGLL